MKVSDLINVIAIIVAIVGIIIEIPQLIRSNQKSFTGLFFTYRSESDRKTGAFMTRLVYIVDFFFLVLIVWGFVQANTEIVPDLLLKHEFMIFEIAIIIAMNTISTIMNQFFWAHRFRIIDKWIEENEILTILEFGVMACLILISTTYPVVALLNYAVFGSSGTLCIILLIYTSMLSVFVSYIRTYFIFRVLYAVTSTAVILKESNRRYDDVQDYRFQKGEFIFIYESDGVLYKVQTNRDSVLSIEQTIDSNLTLKDVRLLLNENQVQDKTSIK